MSRRNPIALAVAAALASSGSGTWPVAHAATLPVPCSGAACGSAGFVGMGQATAAQSGSRLTVNQASANAILNWKSFNISADGTVQFVQPSASSVALNRSFQADPMQIFGALNANGHVYLINQNGIIFGPHAQVNVGGLLASTLNLAPQVTANGQISLTAAGLSSPTLEPFSNGAASQAVSIEAGAQLTSAEGGQILVFAPAITNQGTITTPGGQTVLAAGNTVYLTSNDPTDTSMRGLVVALGTGGGTVTNGTAADSTVTSPAQLAGQIIAERGNVTLAGLAVNQYGRVSATTSINENGSIFLEAGDGSTSIPGSAGLPAQHTVPPSLGGTLTLGENSDTEVTLDTSDPSTTVYSASTQQLPSTVLMYGSTIDMLADATARATAGQIDVTASAGTQGAKPSSTPDGSRFYMAPGALLDVSGASVVLPVSSTVIPVKLEGVELADDPEQRNGFLHGQTVYVDIHQGTPLANISGEIGAIQYDVAERNLAGGTVSIDATHGDVILAPNAEINLSGGQIQYTSGYLDTTKLVTSTGQIVDIGSAQPGLDYVGIANSLTLSDPKWGVLQTYAAAQPVYSPGYTEGKDAGTLELNAPKFVFDASVTATTVAGLYQTQPDTSPSALPSQWGATSQYRPYNQMPKGATLQIGGPSGYQDGTDNTTASITIAPGEVLPQLRNSDGSPFDPLTDALPNNFTTSFLRPDLFGPGEFDNVSLLLNDQYLQPAGTAIGLTPGGSFSVTAQVVDIQGSIDVPGGDITATAAPTYLATEDIDSGAYQNISLTLGSQAALAAEGAWVNENPLLYPNGNTSALYTSGGTISLAASDPITVDQRSATNLSNVPAAVMDLAPGSVIDVSGGGEYSASGKLVAGTGGTIAIAASTPESSLIGAPPQLFLGSTLHGYGIYEGGTLSITASGVCIAAADCSGGDPTVVWFSPQMLNDGGFSSYELQADQGALTVAPGTVLTLQQQNLQLPANFAYLPDAPSLAGIAALTVLPELVRQPTNLSLNEAYAANAADQLASGTDVPALCPVPSDCQSALSLPISLLPVPSLVIGQGALINVDPTGSISISSDTRLIADGTLRAPGGAISLNLTPTQAEGHYDQSQAIWLGSGAVIDASGAPQISINAAGLRSGQVLDGGTVSLAAAPGYIEMLPGSEINVSGSAGIIDVTPSGGGRAQPEQIASAGGIVNLSASYGLDLGGTLKGAPGTAGAGIEQPAGGVLNVSLNPGVASALPPAFSPTIVLTQSAVPTVVEPGSSVPNGFVDQAFVSADVLASSGLDIVSLKAASYNSAGTQEPGRIEFQGDVTLAAPREISLDAAVYTVTPGAVAQVRAPYVEFGSSDNTILYTPGYSATGVDNGPSVGTNPAATSGTGALEISGGYVEIYGYTALQGIGTASFTSAGDLRLRGIEPEFAGAQAGLEGGLFADGAVDLSAAQIYPTTLSQFTISADPGSVGRNYANPTAGTIEIQGVPGAASDLLTAGGAITLSAANIVQGGVLRAPFGTITFDANSLTLGAGSVTSTSADGETIPFGTTRGGLDWVYQWTDTLFSLYGTGGAPPPSQNIVLNGTNIDVQKGATIDVSGGGDLQAYEFVAGTTGTNDVLSASYSKLNGGQNEYAIIPGLSLAVAPYDPIESAGTNLQPGAAVYLSGGSGVPAGTYILLPAYYALLPGAYLISPTSGYRDIAPGQTFPALDGGTIVAGYLTVAGLGVGSSRTSGFDVTPASLVLSGPAEEAQYNLTSGNSFFAAQAASAGVAPPRLPEDSGLLQIAASNALVLDGTLDAAPGTHGAGADVDISSANIVVAGDGGASAPAGTLVLSASSLNQLGAQSLLLGGERSAEPQITSISVDNGGSGYEVGDIIVLNATGTVSGATLLKVTSVDSGGAVTGFSLLSTASYELAGEPGGAVQQASVSTASGANWQGTAASFGLTFANIDVVAQSITVANGATLSASQVMLAAQNAVTVASGATIAPSGTGPQSTAQQLGGDSAFLSVSAGPQLVLSRDNPAGLQGVLTLDAGSMLSAPGGSIYLSASQNIAAQGNVGISGGDLAVEATAIALGAPPGGSGANAVTTLGQNVLGASGLRTLLLQSESSIDLNGSVGVSAQNVTLEAQNIEGSGGANDVAAISAADTLTLLNPTASAANPTGTTQPTPGSGQGALTLTAADIVLAGGYITLDGFKGGVSLEAQNALTGAEMPQGAGASTAGAGAQSTPQVSPVTTVDGLSLTGGDLTVTASRITTDSGVSLSLGTTGAVALLAPSTPTALPAVTSLGGSLSVSGSSIEVGTQIDLPSGRVVLSTGTPITGQNGSPPTGTGDIALEAGGAINVAGVLQQYDGVNVASPGGSVELDSRGDVSLLAGSSIDVSAGTGGAAGSLSITAPNGTVTLAGNLSGTGGTQGGSFGVEAQAFGSGFDFTAFNQQLNGDGFSGSRSFWLRGTGNLDLETGSAAQPATIDAQDVSLEADAGSITIGAGSSIGASGASGGTVTLAASNGIDLAGTINASANAPGGPGGTVELDVENSAAPLVLGNSSIIDVSGGGPGSSGMGAGGTVLLRVPYSSIEALAQNGPANAAVAFEPGASIVGASRTTLEAFASYLNTTGVISQADVEANLPQLADFASIAGPARAALAPSASWNFVLVPGVEVDATPQSNGTGALELDSDWNLGAWRFTAADGSETEVPGILTLRATNGVTFNAALSDGFADTPANGSYTPFLQGTVGSDSWSYRIVAGADLAAANPLAVTSPGLDGTQPANVTITGHNIVRTGDGFIDVSASGDFALSDASAVLYTAGVASATAVAPPEGTRGVGTGLYVGGQPLAYPVDGGNIHIDVTGDVAGTPVGQLVNAWLWRTGSTTGNSITAWTVAFQDFQQGVGALGGGNVSVRAGGDISDLSVSIPTVGELVGGSTAASSTLDVVDGGNLDIEAGKSILGGIYYVGQGSATLRAGIDLGPGADAVAPVIALGDATVDVTAGRNVGLGAIVNPTLLNIGVSENLSNTPYFSTYSADSSIDLTSIGGSVVLDQDGFNLLVNEVQGSFHGASAGHSGSLWPIGISQYDPQSHPIAFDLVPPTMNVEALGGDIDLNRELLLDPSSSGNLQMFAHGSVLLQPGSELVVSGADPTLLPTAAAPQSGLSRFADMTNFSSPQSDQFAAVPVHLGEDETNPNPVRIVAETGDVDLVAPSSSSSFWPVVWSSKPVEIVAGGNISNLNLTAQNLTASDVTSVTAGGSITYPTAYNPSGEINQNSAGITVSGPGQLELAAGGNIDLGTSSGVVTVANLADDPYIAPTGASISMEAGLSGGPAPQYASFISQYIDGSTAFDSDLVAFVESVNGSVNLTAAQAKALFGSMSAGLQRAFLEQVFFQLLEQYGVASANKTGSIQGAYDAIEALFPGAYSASDQADPYSGNINLYFSQVTTEQGGNVSILAPGGSIDAGLSEAPSAFGANVQKTPEELGIVAQGKGKVDIFSNGSLTVDQSRVFAANGGDILVWSTEGDIDAGAGSKTAISAPTPEITYDANGQPTIVFVAPRAGSGIQAQSATAGVPPGNVYLFAPHGKVIANDAGIAAQNLYVVATQVLGTNNITVSGTEVGVPVTVTGLGANVVGASSSAAGAMTSGTQSLMERPETTRAPEADSALNWLDVFVLGFGEQNCKPDDEACLQSEHATH